MSDRKEITKILSLSIKMHENPRNDPRIYWAREVTFDCQCSKGGLYEIHSEEQ